MSFPPKGISVLSILAPLCSHEWLISQWGTNKKQDRMMVLERETHTHRHADSLIQKEFPSSLLFGSDCGEGVNVQMAEGWTAG